MEQPLTKGDKWWFAAYAVVVFFSAYIGAVRFDSDYVSVMVMMLIPLSAVYVHASNHVTHWYKHDISGL